MQAGGRSGDLDRGFSVNASPDLSHLERIDPALLSADLPKSRVRVARDFGDVQRYVNVGRTGRELFPWAVSLVALVWCAEGLLANRFYRGGPHERMADRPPSGAAGHCCCWRCSWPPCCWSSPRGMQLSARRRWTLFALRAASALVLLLLMLRPAIETVTTRKLPGTLLVLLDNSRSMQVEDSLANQSRWQALRGVLGDSSEQLCRARRVVGRPAVYVQRRVHPRYLHQG